jgi:hypothetical protein
VPSCEVSSGGSKFFKRLLTAKWIITGKNIEELTGIFFADMIQKVTQLQVNKYQEDRV